MQLLAYLGLRTEPAPRAAIAAALWPDEIDTVARLNLRRHIHQLRRGLPHIDGVQWLVEASGTIGWNIASPSSIDVATFSHLIDDQATRRTALALVDGDLLAGFDDEWLVVAREQLRSRYHEALLDEAIASRRARDFVTASFYAERLSAADDLREDAIREMMAARYEHGDRGSALATYERFAARLSETLGVSPTPETEALAAQLRAGMTLFVDDPLDGATENAPLTAFAGRDADLAILRAAWTRAARGSGTTVFVGGEAGIGKTRLIAELARNVRAGGGRVVVGATSDPEAESYQAVFGVLRQLVPFAAGLAPGESMYVPLAHALPELRGLISMDDSGARSEALAQERLFEAITGFIEHVARMKPLLIVLEDLHWSGEATIDALGALARRAGTLPLLIVATYRSDETAAGHPLRDLRAALSAQHHCRSLALRRLNGAGVEHMLEVPELRDAPPDLAATIYRISEGNPLFTAQLARAFLETGTVPAGMPAGAIGATIANRIVRLDPKVRAIGEVAAMIGETFGLDAVRDTGGWDEGDVMDAFGHLMDAMMIREAGGSHGYAFTHALIADAMYESIPISTRIPRHRRIAQLIERRDANDRASLEAIARHWRRAGDRARASTAYVQSALAALDVFARVDAVSFARIAADLADTDVARFAALRIAAAAPARSGEREGWEADLDRLSAIADALGDDERFEATALREAYLWQCGQPVDSAAASDELIAIAERTGSAKHLSIGLERRSRADSLVSHAMSTAPFGWQRRLLVNNPSAFQHRTMVQTFKT